MSGDRLVLEGELTIYRAAEVKAQIVEWLEQALRPQLDLSQITEIDTAGVQLLLFARREAQRAGHPATLHAPSDAVRRAMDLLDLTEHLAPA